MNFWFILFSMAFSSFFIFMNHPLSLGFMLMIQTISISILIGLLSKSFWFSYILFITFLGGMLILFIYMTSLSSKENFNFSMNSIIMFMLMFIMLSILIYYSDFILIKYNKNIDSFMNLYWDMNLNIYNINMNKLYNFPNNMMTILLILYLLMTLFISIFMTNMFLGPLRKNF